MSRWEIQVKLNLSLEASTTFADDPPGPLNAMASVLNLILTTKRFTDVKLKFQLRDAGCPSNSSIFAGFGSTLELDAVITGGGSYHVTLPPSEIEDCSHLHWVLLEWQDICWQGSEFHCQQNYLSLSRKKIILKHYNIYLLTQEQLKTISQLRSVQNAQQYFS